MSSRNKRLAREVVDCQKDESGVTIQQLDGDSMEHFVGRFGGPQGTAYEGGTFEVSITVPEKYPFVPLQMKFITKVYHPNISSATGFICLDILTAASWSPVFTLRTCLVSLQSLLSEPQPQDPQDAEVAKHYLTSRESFEQTARAWTEVYAMGPDSARKGKRTEAAAAREADAASVAAFGADSGGGSGDALAGLRHTARLAGIEWADVETFSDMGFDPSQIVDVLKLLNYRGSNRQTVGHDRVIEKLCQ